MNEQLKKTLRSLLWTLRGEKFERMVEMNAKLLSTALLHQKTFLPYKNYCKGEKDIVVCGAGPTLNQYEPIEGAIHIAVNRAFLYDKVNFDFIFAQDYDGIKMVEQDMVKYRPGECVKFLGTQIDEKKMIPESLILKCGALRFDTDGYIYRDGTKGKMIVDLESRPLCNMMNVGQSVMQLALYMNPRRIYIVGCDMSGAHFANGNESQAEREERDNRVRKTWEESREKLLHRWREIKNFASIYYPDTEIISVNPVGLKGMFKDLYQHE